MRTRGLVWGLVGFAIALAVGATLAVVRERLCRKQQVDAAPVGPESTPEAVVPEPVEG